MNKPEEDERGIEWLEHYRRTLLAKLDGLRKDLEAADRVILGVRAAQVGDGDAIASISQGYAGLAPQKAVRRFFGENPRYPFKPSVLAKKLRALGFEPTTESKNVFVTQVRTACKRLVDKGLLHQTEVDGKVAFRFDGKRPDTEVSDGEKSA